MQKIARNIIPAVILAFFGAFIAYAQVSPLNQDAPFVTPSPIQDAPTNQFTSSLVQPITIVATPSSPSPGQSITVEAQTPTIEPYGANFVWTIDGASRPDISGFGKNTFTYTAAEVGSAKRVSVRVQPTGNTPFSGSQTIYTTDLVLTWTAKTYTPKWYKGKALPVPNSTLRVAAIPTFIIGGSMIPPNRLIYTWNVNGNRMLKGTGKQVFELQAPEQSWDTPTVILEIKDMEQRVHKEVPIGIVSQRTHAVIYQTLPLGGVEFRRGTSAFPSIAPSIVDLQVEPFFFNTQSKYDLSYQWSVQSTIATSSPQNPFILTLDMQQSPPSDVPISVIIHDKDNAVPPASSFLSIPIH